MPQGGYGRAGLHLPSPLPCLAMAPSEEPTHEPVSQPGLDLSLCPSLAMFDPDSLSGPDTGRICGLTVSPDPGISLASGSYLFIAGELLVDL